MPPSDSEIDDIGILNQFAHTLTELSVTDTVSSSVIPSVGSTKRHGGMFFLKMPDKVCDNLYLTN